MKKTKTIKAIALALLCTLLVGAAVGIGISADTTDEDKAKIGMKNLIYDDMLALAFQLELAADASGELGLAVWPMDQENPTWENAIYKTDKIYTGTDDDGNTVKYAVSQGFAAKDLDVMYQFGAILIVDGVYTVEQIVPYSVDTYIQARIDKIGADPSEYQKKQLALYDAVISLGDATDKVLQPTETTE